MDSQTREKLTAKSTYTSEELDHLYNNFKRLAAKRKDGLIDRAMCTELMNCNNTAFTDGLFRLFNRDGAGGIDFVEFTTSLALYQGKAKNVPETEKKKLFFKIYDVDGDDEISQKDLATLLKSCFDCAMMEVPQNVIDELVKDTFAKYELTPRGTISLQSYSKSAFSHSSGYM